MKLSWSDISPSTNWTLCVGKLWHSLVQNTAATQKIRKSLCNSSNWTIKLMKRFTFWWNKLKKLVFILNIHLKNKKHVNNTQICSCYKKTQQIPKYQNHRWQNTCDHFSRRGYDTGPPSLTNKRWDYKHKKCISSIVENNINTVITIRLQYKRNQLNYILHWHTGGNA